MHIPQILQENKEKKKFDKMGIQKKNKEEGRKWEFNHNFPTIWLVVPVPKLYYLLASQVYKTRFWPINQVSKTQFPWSDHVQCDIFFHVATTWKLSF